MFLIFVGVWRHGKVDGGGETVGTYGHYDVSAGGYWGVFERGGCWVALFYEEGEGADFSV